MKEIRIFVAILQALESPSKACCRLCTSEVRGSNPLGSTSESIRFAGKTRYKRRPEIACQKLVQQPNHTLYNIKKKTHRRNIAVCGYSAVPRNP
jgi:hypothetical protein